MNVFGKYEVIRRLAIGGMGEIFLARQTGVAGFDRPVILKSLLPELAESPRAVEQFLDEARIAATLNHPGIVNVYEVGLWRGVYFIAMEYIAGENIGVILKTLGENKERMPIPLAAVVIRDAALALHHAHHAKAPDGTSLELVHRDISPQNIMIRTDGVTKVVDFGIAKTAIRSIRTRTGLVKGRLRYMSSEQLTGQTMDGRSDQYSLGVVFWEMCIGKRMFPRNGAGNEADEFQEARSNLEKKIRAPKELHDDVPAEINDIILRMLERNATDRFQESKEVADALSGYLARLDKSYSQQDVGEFVQKVMGDRIADKTKANVGDKDNFLIALSGVGTGSASRSESTDAATKTERSFSADVTRNESAPAEMMLAELASVSLVDESTGSGLLVAQQQPRSRVRVGMLAMLGVLLVGGGVLIGGQRSQSSEPQKVNEAKLVVAAPPVEQKEAPKSTKLYLDTKPSHAMVRAGTLLLGTTPIEVDTLMPNVQQVLNIELRGYKPQEIELTIAPGETRKLVVDLVAIKEAKVAKVAIKPAPTAVAVATPVPVPVPADGPGFLTLRTTPWTKVFVAGQAVGSTPLFKLKLPAGKHEVRFVNEGLNIDVTKTITVEREQTAKLDLNLN